MSYKVVLPPLLMLLLLPAYCQTLPSTPTPPSAPSEAQSHLRLAQEYLGRQQTDLAISELQKVVALEPDNFEARGNLGVLLFFRGDYAGAAPQLRAALQANPDLMKIRALLGLAEGRLGDTSASLKDLETAYPSLTEEKIKAEVGWALIDTYTATEEREKAANIASSMLAKNPTDTNLLYTTYRLYSDLADKTMLTLLMSAPDSAQTHEVMARALARHGDESPAIANYRDAIRLDPKMAGLHTELAQLLYSSSDDKVRAQAESEFKAALAQNPSDENAQLMLGVIAAKRGDLATAYADDSKAVKLQANDEDACTELAKVLISMNKLDQAQPLLERAIQIDPSDYMAHYFLSTLYHRLGKSTEAQEQVALYKRYKAMQDKLQSLYKNMRLESATRASSEDDDVSK